MSSIVLPLIGDPQLRCLSIRTLGGLNEHLLEECRTIYVRISESESDIGIGSHSDRSEISESDRISYALHREFLDSLYKVRVSVNPYLFFFEVY